MFLLELWHGFPAESWLRSGTEPWIAAWYFSDQKGGVIEHSGLVLALYLTLVLGTAVRQDWELVISQEKRIWVSSVKLKGAEWDKKICTGPDFMRVIMGGECRASLRWILWFDKGYSANKFNVDRFTVFLPWKGPHHTVVLDNSIHNLELVSMNCGEPQWPLRPWCTIN